MKGTMGPEKSMIPARHEVDGKPPLEPSYLTPNGRDGSSGSDSGSGSEHLAVADKRGFELPPSLQWIPANWNWSKLKPVIRSAIAGWIAAILFVIPAVEVLMGQVRT
jgi:hypothetical protein